MRSILCLLIVLLIPYSVPAEEPDFNIVGSSVNFQIVGGVEKPKEEPIPAKPVGNGWKWDAQKRVWWKIEQPRTISVPNYFNTTDCPSCRSR